MPARERKREMAGVREAQWRQQRGRQLGPPPRGPPGLHRPRFEPVDREKVPSLSLRVSDFAIVTSVFLLLCRKIFIISEILNFICRLARCCFEFSLGYAGYSHCRLHLLFVFLLLCMKLVWETLFFFFFCIDIRIKKNTRTY